jgi:hypothetical protein
MNTDDVGVGNGSSHREVIVVVADGRHQDMPMCVD